VYRRRGEKEQRWIPSVTSSAQILTPVFVCNTHMHVLCIRKFISVRVCACIWSQLHLFLVRCACVLLWGVLRIGKRCGLKCSICGSLMPVLPWIVFFGHVYRGKALNVQVHGMQMGMYHASMTRACRQRQRQRHALTACCAIAQDPVSLWQCSDYAPTRRLWLAGQSNVCNPCPQRMRCCCEYRTWMAICVVEHACSVHVFDVEGMSLMCMRAYC